MRWVLPSVLLVSSLLACSIGTPTPPAPVADVPTATLPAAAAPPTEQPPTPASLTTAPPPPPPTATPAPTPTDQSPPPLTPTPTIPGLWLEDRFENLDNDGDFDRGLWRRSDDLTIFEQNNGILKISRQSPDIGELEYGPLKVEEIGFAEANLKLDDNIKAPLANISITLRKSDWWLNCSISREQQKAEDWVDCYTGDNYGTELISVQHNSWHKLRFEVNPDTAALSFFLDDTNIGRYSPPDPEAFKQAQVTFTLKVWAENGGLITGYFDDVRVGKAQAGVSEVDPALYDCFCDPVYEGTFDPEKWAIDGALAQIGQQNGEMVFTLAQPEPDDVAGLHLIQPETWTLDQYQFIEAKLRLSSETETSSGGDGNIALDLGAPFENNHTLGFQCVISKQEPVKVGCFASEWNKISQTVEYTDIGFKLTNFDIWHTIRMEIDPEVNVTFYIDGEKLGSYRLKEADAVKDGPFWFGIWMWSETQDSIKGYADDVRIGRLGQ